jgi:hypothetical protein
MDLERLGVTFQVPPCWTVKQTQDNPSAIEELLEFQCGNELGGRLTGMTAGVELDGFSQMMVKAFSPQCREVNVLKREPFLTDGIRLDLRTSNTAPDTLRWTLVYLFHRGRILEFRFWTHAGNWYLHATEVEDLLKSITLIHPKDKPVRTGPCISKQHGYQLHLPPGWSFLEVDPPESRIVGRFWTGRGLPAGMVMRIDLQFSASEWMDRYVKSLQDQKRLLEEPKRTDGERESFVELISQMQDVRYRHFDRVCQRGECILQCEVWAPAQEKPEIHSTLKGIVDSFAPLK